MLARSVLAIEAGKSTLLLRSFFYCLSFFIFLGESSMQLVDDEESLGKQKSYFFDCYFIDF